MGDTKYTATFTNDLFAEQTETVTDIAINPDAHDWSEVDYDWSEDKSSCTASRTCSRCDKEENETVPSASEVTTPAGCETAGVTTYTATFTNAAFGVKTETAALPKATGHDWTFDGFSWTGNTAVAEYYCANDDKHTKTVTPVITSEVTEPDCEVPGKTTYTATVTADKSPDEKEHTHSKDVTIPALEHVWQFVNFSWTEDGNGGYTAVANYKCERNEEHTKTVDAAVTFETTNPQCQVAGQTVYTAVVAAGDSLDGKAHDATKTVAIPALDHVWKFVDFSWTEDGNGGYTAVANYKCTLNDAHKETVAATVTSEITTDATCEATGLKVFTAKVAAGDSLDGDPHEITKEVELPALGHDWEFVDFTWTEDGNGGYNATANLKCTRNEEHKTTAPATKVTSATTPATCEVNGKTVYTATISVNGNEISKTKTEIIVAPGHSPINIAGVPATCTEDGIKAGVKCATCGEILGGCEKIPATGHKWGEATYEWAADNSTVTATRVCENDKAHVDTETVKTTSKVTKDATVDATGVETFTATFENKEFSVQTKDVEIPKLNPNPSTEPTKPAEPTTKPAEPTKVPADDISLKLDKKTADVVCGKTLTLKATLKGSTDKITWKTSDKKIATVDANGKVTAKMAGAVTITASAAGKTAECKVQVLYKDVTNSKDFWYTPTYYLTNKGVVKGYDKQTKFKPANECTRAQMVTFIWRLMGEPAPKTKTCKFKDVKKTDYFYKACLWGNENHIVEGYKNGTFGPQIVCARRHAVTFLWRLAGKPTPKNAKNKFSDVKKSDYFYTATLWASETGILAGYSDGTFKPDGDCLRRQMVTFLYKYDKFVNGNK